MLRWLMVLHLMAGAGAIAAQPAAGLPRVGIITAAPPERPLSPNSGALVQGLQEAGFVDGQTVLLEWRFAANDPARFPKLAADLVRAKVDVIVATRTIE